MQPYHLLVCDDEVYLREMVPRFVERFLPHIYADCIFETCSRSEEVFRLLGQHKLSADIVISDINFEKTGGKKEDGIAIFEAINHYDARIQVLLVTKYDYAESKIIRAHQQGLCGWIQQPVEEARLFDKCPRCKTPVDRDAASDQEFPACGACGTPVDRVWYEMQNVINAMFSAVVASSRIVHVPAESQYRICICDDEPSLREVVPRFLDAFFPGRKAHLHFEVASSIGEVIQHIANRDFEVDLLISDVNFEKAGGSTMDGIELLHKTREYNPAIHVILVTKYDYKEAEIIEAHQRGLCAWLQIPSEECAVLPACPRCRHVVDLKKAKEEGFPACPVCDTPVAQFWYEMQNALNGVFAAIDAERFAQAPITVEPPRLAELGARLYAEIEGQLLVEHRGQYVTIEVESGEWFVGRDANEAERKARACIPMRPLYTRPIGDS